MVKSFFWKSIKHATIKKTRENVNNYVFYKFIFKSTYKQNWEVNGSLGNHNYNIEDKESLVMIETTCYRSIRIINNV